MEVDERGSLMIKLGECVNMGVWGCTLWKRRELRVIIKPDVTFLNVVVVSWFLKQTPSAYN